MENVSTAERIMVEMVGRDLYMLDEIDRRIQHVCKKVPAGKNNLKFLALLYGYRMPVVSAISRNPDGVGTVTQGDRTEESRRYFQRTCR
jgi:hypothetical protein